MNRFATTVLAAVGLVSAGQVLSAPATAEPSPGVPCLSLVQQLAASVFTDRAAPITDAAAAVADVLAAPPLSLPAVSGFPVQLPNGIPLPTDLVCEGTAWSAPNAVVK